LTRTRRDCAQRNSVCYVEPDRDSLGSKYDEFGTVEVPKLCQQQPDERAQYIRPDSLLPPPSFEYRPFSYWRDSDQTTLYSAPLRTSSTSSYEPVTLHRSQSFAKRGVTPSQLESLCSDLVLSDQSSCCSSEARPTTPASGLTPPLSFSSTTDSSPSSIMTYASSQDMFQIYGTVENVEQPKEKNKKIQPKRLVLGETESRANARARNISAPIPSPKFPDANTAAAFSYHRTPSSKSCAPTPSPVPTLTNEVSVFDFDSEDDDEKGKISRLKIKTVKSLQNHRKQTRSRADSASCTPPVPNAVPTTIERTSNATVKRGSKGSLNLRSSKESQQPTSPTPAVAAPASPATVTRIASHGTAYTIYHSILSHDNRASSEAKPSSPITKHQKKLSDRRKRSNTVASTRFPPAPPPNTPLPPTPTLAAQRQSRASWYSCFSRTDNTAANSYITAAQKNRRSKTPARPSKIRALMRQVFRLRK
jgi:hypothetical protein